MFVFCQLGRHTLVKDVDTNFRVEHLLNSLNINDGSFYVIQNGRRVKDSSALEDGNTYHFVPRILGGKGGFGSMLRAIGAQIEKTTSREACRDLSGRRMRDVNNEKKLKDWLAKESDRERERDERRQEKLARQLAGPKHNFDDPEYHKQRSKVQEDLDDALQKGLKRTSDKNGDASTSSQPGPAKKSRSSKNEWLGMDIDSDDLDSGSENEADPGPLNPMNDNEGTFKSENSPEDDNAAAATDSVESNECTTSACDIKPECDQDMVDIQHKSYSTHSSDAASLAAKVKEEVVNSDEPIDLDEIKSYDELIAMGLERLKNSLMIRGLKCGGTLEQRAERLFSIKGLTPDQFPSSLIAKSKGGGKKSK